MRNWRTTVLGIVAIGAAGFGLLNDALPVLFTGNMLGAWSIVAENWEATLAAIAAGWALIHAADAKTVEPPA